MELLISPQIIIKERLSGKKNDDTNFIILLESYIAMARQSINAVLQYLIVKSSEAKWYAHKKCVHWHCAI